MRKGKTDLRGKEIGRKEVKRDVKRKEERGMVIGKEWALKETRKWVYRERKKQLCGGGKEGVADVRGRREDGGRESG